MRKTDVLLYAAIAGLTALESTSDPLSWRQAVGIALAVTIAIKAKLSPGKDDSKTADDSAKETNS